ncbi:MAG: hypothetical protein VKJ86_09500 [Synechococcus sp.]|nr:hypothetical protein [Synechococcus sp.]
MLQKQEILKLKKNFVTQQEAYESQLQLQAENYDLEIANQVAQLEQTITTLQKSLQEQLQEKTRLEEQLRQEKNLSLISQRKLRENNRDIDEILESLEQSQQEVLQQKDLEIDQLKAQLQDYAIHLEQRKIESLSHSESCSSPGFPKGDRLNGEQIATLIDTLFPEITLLRDSLSVLTEQPENLVALIKALKDILDGQAYSAKKVRATDNKWTECRVPHVNLMRLYYQKCKKKSGYQVLISPKKNQKSQDQDYEWLKGQPHC